MNNIENQADARIFSAGNRVLPMERLYNVRDLGGYPAAGGRSVRWNLLYRAGDLNNPSRGDGALIKERRLAVIVDFRSEAEICETPDMVAAGRKAELPIDAGNILTLCRLKASGFWAGSFANSHSESAKLHACVSTGEAVMEELYRRLAEEARPQYREFFAILAEKGNAPVLFHCSAGKDRTGLAAALVLSALGVDREIIYRDYLLSAECLAGKYRALIEAEPDIEPFMSVRRSYLEAAFAYIDECCGGVERYLETELGADSVLLRDLYTC
ncbi:MAG: tyrosine-protein phosphatase [Treponema sp.]|jgi:protein-tyrosine phosphatase|nr:tyrosine-protein phosphatase [Treponema sp.]